jgi:hypothetical protein
MSSINHKSVVKPLIDNVNVDRLLNLVTNLVNINTEHNLNTNATRQMGELVDLKNLDKTKRFIDNKQNINEQQESRFSIRQLLEKNENQLIHKKNFFVISDELKEDDEDISIKIKREILMNKLINDKGIVNEHAFNQDFHDKISNELYLGLSMDSRKFLLSEPDEITFKQIHELIEFDEKQKTNISNEIILNLCNGFIKLSNSKLLKI